MSNSLLGVVVGGPDPLQYFLEIFSPASSVVDRGFEPRSGQTKDYEKKISCCFSAKHSALKRKNIDWLARNQYNVSEWGDMSVRELLFQ